MINQALKHYHFGSPNVELIRHNENMTYKITDTEKTYVLRVHRPIEGFNLDLLCFGMDKTNLIADEMELLQYLAGKGDIQTQKVKFNDCGKPVTLLDDGTPVTVLEWIEGATLDSVDITEEIAYKLGVMIGELHNSLSHSTFRHRYRYDGILLSKMIDEASEALLQGHFSDQHTIIIKGSLSCIKDYLLSVNDRFIIVHADLGKSNLIYHNGAIIPIDFSLSGYCIPEMDLASAFTHINDEAMNREVLNGYKSICGFEIENYGIQICFCLQILLFIIIQHNKFAGENWFQDMLNNWCEKHFTPLIEKTATWVSHFSAEYYEGE